MPELFNGTQVTTIAESDRLALNVPSQSGSKNILWSAFKTLLTTLYVSLTGNQTIAGVKTFSSPPVVPTPTSDSHAVNRSYVNNGGAIRILTAVTIINGNAEIDLGQSTYNPKALIAIKDSDSYQILNSFAQWKFIQDGNYKLQIYNGGPELTGLTLYYL